MITTLMFFVVAQGKIICKCKLLQNKSMSILNLHSNIFVLLSFLGHFYYYFCWRFAITNIPDICCQHRANYCLMMQLWTKQDNSCKTFVLKLHKNNCLQNCSHSLIEHFLLFMIILNLILNLLFHNL